MSSRRLRYIAAILLAGLLSGCASWAPKGIELPDMSVWEARQQVLGELNAWEFRGRIAVKTGDDGFNAKFNWHQDDDRFDARVSGPLGIGTVLLEGSDQRIMLTDKDGETAVLDDPEAELFYRYGWTIPVRTLRYWALGIPDPSMPAATTFDESGLLTELEQSNWTVTISRYRDAAGQPMPRTLTATSPETRVRMVIDRWVFLDH